MLPSNGRIPKQRNNYHMTLEELAQLLHMLKNRYDPKWEACVYLQFGLGLRASEVLAATLFDFEEDFKYFNYRQAKSNRIITREPVPETVRQKIKEYVQLNAHRLKNGYLFPTHSGVGQHTSTETYGAFFSKWRRVCAKIYNNPKWLDMIEVNGYTRHRIGSHSLRRLHRTFLAKQLNNDFVVSKLCHYQDVRTFTVYRNEFELLEQKESLVLPVLNPLLESLEANTRFTDGQAQGNNNPTVEKKLIPFSPTN